MIACHELRVGAGTGVLFEIAHTCVIPLNPFQPVPED